MSAHKGAAVKIKKDGVVICSGINQKDISINAELIDDTQGTNRGYRVYLEEIDTKGIDLGFKGIAKDRVLRKIRLADQNLLRNVTYEFANGDTITGNFMMSEYSESGSFKDAIQFSCSFKSTGAYIPDFSASENDNGGSGGGDGGGSGDQLDGKLVAIGRWQSQTDDYFSLQVSGGYLRGLGITFDFEAGEVDHIYQRRRMTNEGSELTKMAICAIDGSYAICCEVDGLFHTRYVGISPYNIDSGIQTVGAWSGTSIESGTDFTLIDCGDSFTPIDIVMVKKGTFIIVTQGRNTIGANQWDIICVDYTAPNALNTKIIPVKLDELGLSSCEFSQVSMRVAVSHDVTDVACAIMFASGGGATYRITTVFNPLTAEVVSQVSASVGPSYDVPDKTTALAGVDVVDETCQSFISSDYYYGHATLSFGGYRLDGSWTEYGQYLKFKTFESRTLVDGQEVFADEEETVLEMAPLVSAKLLECGFSAVGSPKFGRISAFVK